MKVVIERLGHLGDGIAEGPIFVSRTLPGEVVEGEVVNDRIAAPRILTPSTRRISPVCTHYRGCGGCALQHAADDFVAEFKVEVIRSALAARNLPAPVRRLHTSPEQSRRRATFTATRTRKGATIGFHAPGSDQIRDVPECRLVRPALTAILPALQALVMIGGSRKGEMRLTLTETDTGLDLSVTGGKTLDLEMQQALIAQAAKMDLARLSWDGETVVTHRCPLLTFGTAPVVLPPGAFLQATAEGQAALLASVTEALGDDDKPMIDLFSGIGTFALPLSAKRAVHAVESEAAMLEALDRGWRHGKGLHRVTTERRDLFRRPVTPEELSRFAGAVIDPPRAGAEAQTTMLAQSRIERIAFVSCNPVTFARDAGILIGAGYNLKWIDVVDQFRWSPHVELSASLVRD